MSQEGCKNCGAGYQDCACYNDRHAPATNDIEDSMIEAIDKRSEEKEGD